MRNAEIGNKDFELDVLEEAYTSEHWIVRIYKVSRLDILSLSVLTRFSLPSGERLAQQRNPLKTSDSSPAFILDKHQQVQALAFISLSTLLVTKYNVEMFQQVFRNVHFPCE